jgi:hypothetical protein
MAITQSKVRNTNVGPILFLQFVTRSDAREFIRLVHGYMSSWGYFGNPVQAEPTTKGDGYKGFMSELLIERH